MVDTVKEGAAKYIFRNDQETDSHGGGQEGDPYQLDDIFLCSLWCLLFFVVSLQGQ